MFRRACGSCPRRPRQFTRCVEPESSGLARVPSNKLLQPNSPLFLPRQVRVTASFLRWAAPWSPETATDFVGNAAKYLACIADKASDQVGSPISGRSANVEPERGPLTIHPERDTSEIAIEEHAIDRSSVPALNDFQLREESRGVL